LQTLIVSSSPRGAHLDRPTRFDPEDPARETIERHLLFPPLGIDPHPRSQGAGWRPTSSTRSPDRRPSAEASPGQGAAPDASRTLQRSRSSAAPESPGARPQLGAAPARRLLIEVPIRREGHAVPVAGPGRRDAADATSSGHARIPREPVAEPTTRGLHDDHVPTARGSRHCREWELELDAVADQTSRAPPAQRAEPRAGWRRVAQDRVAPSPSGAAAPAHPRPPACGPSPPERAKLATGSTPQRHPALERLPSLMVRMFRSRCSRPALEPCCRGAAVPPAGAS